MKIEFASYVNAIDALEIEDQAVDVIELADGRVIAIDGESIRLFETLEDLVASSDSNFSDRPGILL